jgi:hypothetical protein
MPQNTPLGFPYPLGTDRLSDGDDVIRALATAIDGHTGVLASGLAQVATVGGTTGTLAVTFPAGRFTLPPNVVCTINFGAFGTLSASYAGATAVTNTGFIANVARTGGGSGTLGVFWIASQIT